MLVIGKTYFGPHDARRTVIAVDGDTVTYLAPSTLARGTAALADFIAWSRESARRTYVGADGERRTKIAAGKVFDPATKQPITVVRYVTPADPHQPIAVSHDDWSVWRARAV